MDSNPPDFHFEAFDPNEEVQIKHRNLPHWFQANKAIFVTFRTADSWPKSVILNDIKQLEVWLRTNKLPVSLARSTLFKKSPNHDHLLKLLTPKQRSTFKKLSNRIFHFSLDQCHGACHLSNPEIAKIEADAIQHFNGTKYLVDRFVIMPNHCHAILKFFPGSDLGLIGHSWMRFTARKINKRTGNIGSFWARETFDHIIRSDDQFEYLRAIRTRQPKDGKLTRGQLFLLAAIVKQQTSAAGADPLPKVPPKVIRCVTSEANRASSTEDRRRKMLNRGTLSGRDCRSTIVKQQSSAA